MESYSCTTYREQFNAEILNDKEKQEGCLQVTGDGDILRAEVQYYLSQRKTHPSHQLQSSYAAEGISTLGKRQLAYTERKHLPGELEEIQHGQVSSRSNLQDHP